MCGVYAEHKPPKDYKLKPSLTDSIFHASLTIFQNALTSSLNFSSITNVLFSVVQLLRDVCNILGGT